jgi:guanylate kinase
MDDDARPAARLAVLAGPSGVGKDSVIGLVRACSPSVWLSVPVTTRPKRDHEIDGVNYHFVDRVEFERMIVDGQLLEWAEVAGNLYGTSRAAVEAHLRAGRPVLLKLDPQGARQVRAAMPQAQLVFLAPPGLGELPAADGEFDVTIVNDCVERAAEELVGLLGCSFLTPAQPQISG